MKKQTMALCAATLALFMLFSMASSSSSGYNSYSDDYSDDYSNSNLVSSDVEQTTKASTTTTTTTTIAETTIGKLVTPCEFTIDNVVYGVDVMSLNSIPGDSYGLYSLPSGYMYLVVGVNFINNSRSDIFVSTSDFSVYADNRLCDEKTVFVDGLDSYATISSGREALIYGFFAVPKDYKTIEIEYQKSWLSDKVIITAGKIEPLD